MKNERTSITQNYLFNAAMSITSMVLGTGAGIFTTVVEARCNGR
jgi:ABC-type polysaccharide transport system permease subunit